MSITTEIRATAFLRFTVMLSFLLATVPPLQCQVARAESTLGFSVHVRKATSRIETFGLESTTGEGATRSIRIPFEAIGLDGISSQKYQVIARVRGGSRNDSIGFVGRVEDGQRFVPFVTDARADGSVLMADSAEVRRAIKQSRVLELRWTQRSVPTTDESVVELEIRRY